MKFIKSLLAILISIMLVIPAWGTTTTTTNYGFPVPPLGTTGTADGYGTLLQSADTALKGALDGKQPAPIQSTSLTPAVGTAGAKVYVVKTITSDASGVFGVPTGTPVEGQSIDYLLISDANGGWVLDMATAACFQAVGTVLPTLTVASKITAVGVRWNATRSKWLVYAVSQEQ